MLNQILTNTPLYVWAILAFLIVRGVIALRTRDLAINKLFIIPVVMLALSLFDIAAKFGLGGIGFATWIATVGVTLALLVRYSAARIAPAAQAGHVVVRGSVFPLALMMAIFITKYVTSVAVVVQPHLRDNTLFIVVVCALFGLFSGYFLGRLVRDLMAYRAFPGQLQAI